MDLVVQAWGGRWCSVVRDYDDGDGWREYDDAVPIVATTLELLAEHGPLGPVWWRFDRPGRHSLIEAWTTRTTAPPTTSASRPGRRRPATPTGS
ncbi:hypothetical protein ACWC9T_39925 [Kitasatospora sp. NPDC001159]